MLRLFDIRYAFSSLVKSQSFLFMSTLLMTCGLGLFIFMQSFIYNTLEGPLPFDGGERVRVLWTKLSNGSSDPTIRMADFNDIQKRQTSFEKLGIYTGRTLQVKFGINVINEWVYFVGEDTFELVDVKPIKGRLIQADDSNPGAESVIVISELIWREYLGSDPDVIGSKIEYQDKQHTIVGVTPEYFRFPQSARLWAPLPPEAPAGATRADSPERIVFGRLKPGIDDEAAEKELQWIMAELDKQYPDQQNGRSMAVETYQANASMLDQPTATAIKLAVILVLILACINTGSLLLSRLLSRAQVTAINRALGATRGQLFSQMMLDSIIITALSCVLALILASTLMSVTFDNLITNHSMVPYWWELSLTSHSIMQAILVSVLSVIVIGAIPAWKVANIDPNSFLRVGTRGAQSKKSGLINKIIVVVEVGIASAILIVTASILNRVQEVRQIEYGATIDKQVTAWVDLPSSYDNDLSKANFYRSLKARLEQEPDIEQVSFGVTTPLANAYISDVQIEGENYGKDPKYPTVDINIVSHDYFENFDIQLQQGRLFGLSEKVDSPQVAIVTDMFVKEHFPGTDVIGKRFKLLRPSEDWLRINASSDQWFTIVGVVNNVLNGSPEKDNLDRPSIFLSHEQSVQRLTMVAVKANGVEPEVLKDKYRITLNTDYPNVMTVFIASINEKKKRENRDRIFVAQQFMVFGLVSILLAFTGIYGVMANTVIHRRQEVGVRRALGASKSSIYKFFLGGTAKLILVGLVVGVSAGIVLTNMLDKSGMVIFSESIAVIISIFVALMIVVATLIPLVRQMKFEPIYALHEE